MIESVSTYKNYDLTQRSDEELVQSFTATGITSYFSELYRRYAHLSFGVCLKILKDETESREVVSDVFKILFSRLPSASVKSFKNYLYTISRNECIRKLRQRKAEALKLSEWQRLENDSSEFVENEGFYTLLEKEPSLAEEVQKAIGKLGEEQQRCIHLFFFEEKSYRDIAVKTGYTEKQVKSYLQNGKRNLGIALQEVLKKRNA
jgi:RNA polymerase sigma-70 factor (ECF subfamily)